MNGKLRPWELYPEIWNTEKEFTLWTCAELGKNLLGSGSIIPIAPSSLDNLEDFVYNCVEQFKDNGFSRVFEKDGRECCVYWIRLPEHTDITKEGYVGITNNFEVRMHQHRENERNKKVFENFDKAICSIILIGDRSYCREVEQKLRPKPYIGWNNAIGGDGGIPKHGLTGTKIARTFYNLRTKTLKLGKAFLPEFDSTAEALEAFAEVYNELKTTEGIFAARTEKEYVSLSDIKKVAASEQHRYWGRKYLIDGVMYAIVELAEKYNVTGNKISCKIRDGWDMERIVEWLKNR